MSVLVANCLKCNVSLNPNQKFCDVCGSKRAVQPLALGKAASNVSTSSSSSPSSSRSSAVKTTAYKCHKCDRSLLPTMKFCDGCGIKRMTKLTTVAQTAPKRRVEEKTTSQDRNRANSSRLMLNQTPKCPKCDKSILSTSKFCKHCGDPISLYSLDDNRGRDRERPLRHTRVASADPTPISTSTSTSGSTPSSASSLRFNKISQSPFAKASSKSRSSYSSPSSSSSVGANYSPKRGRSAIFESKSLKSNAPTSKSNAPTSKSNAPTPKPVPARAMSQQFSPSSQNKLQLPQTARQPLKRSVSAEPVRQRNWHSRSLPASRPGSSSGLNLNNPVTKLRLWVCMQIENYSVPEVLDFTKSWQDGKTLTALVDSCRPGICPLNGMKEGQDVWNLKRAMNIAEQQLNIPAIMDAEHMAHSPEKRSCMTYVSYFYNLKSKKKASRSSLSSPSSSSRTVSTPPAPSLPSFAEHGRSVGTPKKIQQPQKSANIKGSLTTGKKEKICSNCSTAIPLSFKFCDICGRRMD